MTSNRTGFGNKYFMRHIQINYWSPKYKSEGNCTQLNPEAINSLLHHVHYCRTFLYLYWYYFQSERSGIEEKIKWRGHLFLDNIWRTNASFVIIKCACPGWKMHLNGKKVSTMYTWKSNNSSFCLFFMNLFYLCTSC